MQKRYLANCVGSALAALVFQMGCVSSSQAHKDIAPMPANVIEAVVNKPLSPKAEFAEQVSVALKQMEEVLDRSAKGPALGLSAAQSAAFVSNAQADAAAQRATLQAIAKALPGMFSSPEPANRALLEVNKLDALLAGLVRARTPDELKSGAALALAQIKRHQKSNGEGPEPLLLPATPTMSPPQETTLKPIPSTDKRPAYAMGEHGDMPSYAVAMAGGNVPLLDTPAEAAACSYTDADLDKTKDEVNSVKYPELAALAKSLDYSPIKIYEYVYKNIDYKYNYFGLMKGAYGAFLTKSGNNFDQASLLIALLRASNIPARYVLGKIEVADAVPMGAQGRLNRWLGLKSYSAFTQALYVAGGDLAWVRDGQGNAIGGRTLHVWVEACVPYASYRGAALSNRGHRWVPLDPSFKDKTYQPGVQTDVKFDLDAFLAKRTNGPDSLPHEKYIKDVEAAVRVTSPGSSMSSVPYKGTINGLVMDVLPATLPYKVVSWYDVAGGAEFASVPDDYRVSVQLLGKSMPMVEVMFKRLTFYFVDGNGFGFYSIGYWRGTGSLDEAPNCRVPFLYGNNQWTTIPNRVRGVLNLDGVNITGDSYYGASLCPSASENFPPMEVTVSVPALSCTYKSAVTSVGCVNRTTINKINPLNIYSILVYGEQGANDFLASRITKLQASIAANPSNPNADLDGIEGEFLNMVGQKYGRYLSDAGANLAAYSGAIYNNGIHLGVTTAQSKIAYLFDQPFALARQGFFVDMPGGRGSFFDPTTGYRRNDLILTLGRTGSALESYVWQENAKTDAVSSIRGLQYANENKNRVLKLTTQNWATGEPQLTYVGADKRSIMDEVNSGSTVYVPKSPINYDGWAGTVYIAENEARGYGSYMISGGYSGGYSLRNPISYSYNSILKTGYNFYTPPPAPVSFTSIVQNYAPPPVVNSFVNYGRSNGNTYSGDPVNMVTGNMYHNETDVDLSVRGGQHLVFQRAYNSRKPEDGPLGYGWTHSLNQFLTFRDDNVNSTTDGPDTDGITSSVTWTDGSGSEKYIAITAGADAAGVAISATFKTPDGYYFTLTKNADKTYTLNDKGGVSYIFAAADGTKDQRANLVRIQDRNGNAITLNYDGKRLASATDGTRSLTFGYDGASEHIRDVTDSLSRKHTFGYDASGNLTKVWKPGLNVATETPTVTYTYYTTADGTNLNHAMKRYTLARGNFMDFIYYSNGRVLSHSNAKGESMSFRYNDFRRETVQVNEKGLERRFFFDKNGMPLKTIEENLGSRAFTYGDADSADRFSLQESVDPRGTILKYKYEPGTGNLTETTYASGRTEARSNYNAFAQPGKIKDVRGLYTLMKYDSRGNVLETIQLKRGFGASVDPATYAPTATDAVAQIAAWTINTYDAYGNLLTSKRVRDMATKAGPWVEYGYEPTNTYRNKITRYGDKDGDGLIANSEFDTATLEPDALGQVKTGIDDRWESVTYGYDDQGRVQRVTNASGLTTRIEYDANGNVKQETQQATVSGSLRQLQATAHEYDQADRKVRTMANGMTASFDYDPVGNLISQTDPDGHTLGYTYDEMNQVVAAQDKEGNQVTKTLDVDGRPLSVTDPNGLTVSYTYWDATRDSRLKRVTQPKAADFANGRAVEYDYDEVGNTTSTKVIPADGGTPRESLTTYDELSRPVRVVGPIVTDPVNGNIRRVTLYTYDNLSRLTEVRAGRTDASGTNTASDNATLQASYGYDDFGRKLRDTDGAGRSWRYSYNPAGDVLTILDPRGKQTTQQWNPGGTLKSRTNEVGTVTYTRDALGLPTKVTNNNPAYTQEFTYNAQKRVDSVRDSRGNKTLYYEYSPAGQLNAMRDSEGAETNYLYDPLGRLTGLWAANYDYLAFGYDKGGRLTEKWSPNGVKAEYVYNDDGSLSNIRHVVAGAEKAKHGYTYDAWGNRKQHAENLAGSEVTYGYEYDELNRLITARYTQVAADSSTTTTLLGQYRYDILNNRTRQTNPDGSYLNYVYDKVAGVPTNVGAHQLNQIDLYNATDIKQSTQATMGYDAAGNLISKSAGNTLQALGWDANNDLGQVVSQVSSIVGGTPVTTVYNEAYNYDHEGRRLTRQLLVNNTLYLSRYLYNGEDIHKEYGLSWLSPVAAYTHGPQTDDPLIYQDGSGSKYYHADGLGSSTLLTNATGALQAFRRFDPWGRTIGTGGTMPTYGYSGREPDLSTGYMYYRARYYDPTLGRFLSRDPIGLQGGINAYAYVENNPTNNRDPSGLLPQLVSRPASSYYDSAASWASTKASNLGQSALNFMTSGMFKTNAEVESWGRGVQRSQFAGVNATSSYFRNAGMPGSGIKDVAAAAVTGGAATLTRTAMRSAFATFGEGAAVRYGPLNAGPLAQDIANTFRSGTYTGRTLSSEQTFYRTISEGGNPTGSYWTSVKPRGPLQSVIDSALDQNWGNTATNVITARVPTGTTIFEGAAAAQRGLVGGGNQIYIPKVDPSWIVP